MSTQKQLTPPEGVTAQQFAASIKAIRDLINRESNPQFPLNWVEVNKDGTVTVAFEDWE